MWNGSDNTLKTMPLNVSLTLQTAVLEGTLEWEDWELVEGARIPTRASIEKILPGYYDRYNPRTVPNKADFISTLKKRFQQRRNFIMDSDIREYPDLMEELVQSMKVNA